MFNKIYINEDNQLTNANDKNNQTCNSLINSINSSIKLKNNFNDKNYNIDNNNKTCIIVFNENNIKEKNDTNNNTLSNRANIGKTIGFPKIFSPDNKNERIEYSLRGNKDNKDIKNNRERITSIENIKSENRLKQYHHMNINEFNNVVNIKGNSKNKKKINKNGEATDINNNNNKLKKIYNREQTNTNGSNNNNNIIKIDFGKKEKSLSSAKSSINIHSIKNNLINNSQNNNNYMSNRNKKIIIEEKESNNTTNKQIIKKNENNILSLGDKAPHEENINHNISIIKKNQSVNLIASKNNNSLSKRKMNKVKINDNTNDERERDKKKNKNIEDKIIQR